MKTLVQLGGYGDLTIDKHLLIFLFFILLYYPLKEKVSFCSLGFPQVCDFPASTQVHGFLGQAQFKFLWVYFV